MSPYEFGQIIGRKYPSDSFVKYANQNRQSYTPSTNWFHEWLLNSPRGTGTLDYIDKWYNPWTTNTDPMSRGEGWLMWPGRVAMGTGAAAGTAAASIAAAPAVAAGASQAAGALNTPAAIAAGVAIPEVVRLAQSSPEKQKEQTENSGISTPYAAAIGGLGGAALGGLAGYFNPGEAEYVDSTGRIQKRRRHKLKSVLSGLAVGGLAGAGLGALAGQQKTSAAFKYGRTIAEQCKI